MIGVEHFPCAFKDAIQISERDAAQQFGRVWWMVHHEIVKPPDGVCELRLREYPPTAESAQAIDFRQTVGHDELRSEMKSRPRRLFEQRIEIDLSDHYAGFRAKRNIAQGPKCFFINGRVAWIM